MGLDRDEHPVRFAIITSVVSSLVVAIITASASQLDIRLLAYRVPLWILILSLLTTVTFLILATTLLRRRKNQVFIALCALSGKRWIAELIHNLHDALDVYQLDLVLKAPRRDFAHTGQLYHLRNLRKQHGRYTGGIISPMEPGAIKVDLKAFCSFTKYPIVFVDIEPFDSTEEYPRNTVFVGYSQDSIGYCAACYVEEHARRSQISRPRIWVVAGKWWYSRRQTEFIEIIESRFPDAEFVVDDTGEYSRERAREIVWRNLQGQSKEELSPHYIYCTNDEMALGAVDALRIAGAENDDSVVVIGVDGTPEARALIDSQTTPLRATVVQDSREIAEIAVDLLIRMNRGDTVRTCTYLEPCIYKAGHYSVTLPALRSKAGSGLRESERHAGLE